MADGSRISSGTTIVGRVVATTDLEIDGHIEGSVDSSGDVNITASAALKSDVKGERINVAGAIHGNLHGGDAIVLEEGARVLGNVAAPTIGIRPGALIRGRVETSADAPKQTAPARAAKPATRPAAKSVAKPAAKKRRAPAPVIPKAAKTATKRKKTATKAAKKKKAPSRRKAPAPVVPALKKRTKKASKRRAR